MKLMKFANDNNTDNNSTGKNIALGAFGGTAYADKNRGKSRNTHEAMAVGTGAAALGLLSGASPYMTNDNRLKERLASYMKDGEKGMNVIETFYGDKAKERLSKFKNNPEAGVNEINNLSSEELREMKKSGLLKRTGYGALTGGILTGLGYEIKKRFGNSNKNNN